MTDQFKHDYVVYDDQGIAEIRCMASGKVVAGRVETPSEKYPGKTKVMFMRYADYREIPYLCEDGSITFLILCDEHKNVEVGKEEAKLINQQIFRAKKHEMEYGGKTNEFIEKVMQHFERKHIVRKLTDDEVAERFSNLVLK